LQYIPLETTANAPTRPAEMATVYPVTIMFFILAATCDLPVFRKLQQAKYTFYLPPAKLCRSLFLH